MGASKLWADGVGCVLELKIGEGDKKWMTITRLGSPSLLGYWLGDCDDDDMKRREMKECEDKRKMMVKWSAALVVVVVAVVPPCMAVDGDYSMCGDQFFSFDDIFYFIFLLSFLHFASNLIFPLSFCGCNGQGLI